MDALAHETTHGGDVPRSVSNTGLPCRVALACGIAGGLGAEMVVVGAAAARGEGAMAAADPVVTTLCFGVGAGLGLLHGMLLGYIGRPQGMSPIAALRGIGLGGVTLLLLALPAWVVALWVSLTFPALGEGRVGLSLLAMAGWGVSLCVGIWAIEEVLAAVGHAVQRWPERRPGLVLIAVTFASTLTACALVRPEIWFTDLRVTRVGAIFLGAGATIWLGIPAIALGLRVLRMVSTPLGPGTDDSLA
jgi:hypothetical protein